MIKAVLSNSILKQITTIEKYRFHVSNMKLPASTMNRLRKNSKKKSSYASNKIEGNPLSEQQADDAIEHDEHKHFLKPEQEVRNYFAALSFLEEKLIEKQKVTVDFIMAVQAIVEKGAPKEKIGLRGQMPLGVLFAVYDTRTGSPDYIPPESSDIPKLLNELEEYLETTDDHPLIIAAIVHYQLVTIHPFEDGNGRTARLISGYILDYYGYGFLGIGSLEEYFAYDPEEYYASLQMGLPALYYSGRDNPPHPELWIGYFLRMMELYAKKINDISNEVAENGVEASLSHLRMKEKDLLVFILNENIWEFAPIELAKRLGVTNKTIINRTVGLVKSGFIEPVLVKERIRSYILSDFARSNKTSILEALGKQNSVKF
ncbi:Fic family protein [Adlercreutzia sp. ZJ154]|uniref:Fic family protein n=1 Tax=Adlercreutzia sp. ZJ154 TaxID=2709790 RepID=UPI0013EB31B8|nr:Fic family protein [Adlercreutzia sp. ZJ154]